MKKILVLVFLVFMCVLGRTQTIDSCGADIEAKRTLIKTNVSENHMEFLYFDTQNRLHGKSYVKDRYGNLISIACYNHGVKHGNWKIWYDNGQLAYWLIYFNGEKCGTWKYWDKNGVLLKEIRY